MFSEEYGGGGGGVVVNGIKPGNNTFYGEGFGAGGGEDGNKGYPDVVVLTIC